jgi:large subunit GTPase 1
MVGYPNVGKSSVINSLFGKKKVAVASLPGKTKHFQTLPLTDKVTLCDCPGLVFPRISSSYAEMVLNGLVLIDTCKNYA